MTWWRRESLHEQLAREGGLMLQRDASEGSRPPWDKAGIHGVPRPRRWDAVVTAEAPGIPRQELAFVALPDGTLVVDDDVPDEAFSPLAAALEQAVAPPYRAEAVRRTENVWAVAARSIDVVTLAPGTPGDEITITSREGERTTTIDGEHWLAGLPALEQLARERGLTDYVLEAARLDGDSWEVRISAL